MAKSDSVFREGMKPPEEVDGLSAPPVGFKHYLDNSKGGTEWMKQVITANFSVTDVQVFHESKSDIGGNMIVRFQYKGKNIDLPISYQDKLSTLTHQKFSDLAPHIQSMNPDTRGLFNVIINHINAIEKSHTPVKKQVHASLESMSDELQTA